jgi:site-specific DNA-methyltransferase (adenine-specific)
MAEDCIQGMRKLSSKSVDLVVTSPPYNIGLRYNSYKDDIPREAYLHWTATWATEVKRILKPNGSFFLVVGGVPSNPLLPHEIAVELSALFKLQNTFHWVKSVTVHTRNHQTLSVGHFKPINSRRFVNDCHEFVFHFTPDGRTALDRLSLGVPYADKSNIKRWTHTNGRDVRCRGNIWFIPYKTVKNRAAQRPHPATFPTELAANCIKIHGWTLKLVMLDPFLGIGHAALAAKECGIRKFIGFDIDPEYVELAGMNVG